jgi:hypothetical protein
VLYFKAGFSIVSLPLTVSAEGLTVPETMCLGSGNICFGINIIDMADIRILILSGCISTAAMLNSLLPLHVLGNSQLPVQKIHHISGTG